MDFENLINLKLSIILNTKSIDSVDTSRRSWSTCLACADGNDSFENPPGFNNSCARGTKGNAAAITITQIASLSQWHLNGNYRLNELPVRIRTEPSARHNYESQIPIQNSLLDLSRNFSVRFIFIECFASSTASFKLRKVYL